MEALTIHPQNREQLKAIKTVLKAMKIPFEKEDSPYDPEFVKKIQKSRASEGKAIKTKDLWK